MDKSEIKAHAISSQVLQYIQHRGLKSGDQLPAEADMAGELGINRSTLREVYVRMVGQGLIVRQHGMGTFVGQAPIKDGNVVHDGFAGRIGAAGFKPTVDVVVSERVRLDAALAQEFGCDKGTEVSRLVRLFRATGTPAVLIEDHLAPHIDGRKIDLERHALNMIAGLNTQVPMAGARMDLSTTAVALPADKAALLGLPAGSPALHTYSVLRSELGSVIAVAWAWLNPLLVEVKSSRTVSLTSPSLSVAGEIWPVTATASSPGVTNARPVSRKRRAAL